MFNTFGNSTLVASVCCALVGTACVKTLDGELALTDEDTEATANEEVSDGPSELDASSTDADGGEDSETVAVSDDEVPIDEVVTEVASDAGDGDVEVTEDVEEAEDDVDASVEIVEEPELNLDAGTPEPEPDLIEAVPTPVLDAGWIDTTECTFASDPVPFTLPPDALPDAGPPPAPQILLGDSPFLGPYLTDGAGYALYIYTADLPGDCNNPPVANCVEDCVLSWPVFEAWDRELGEGLNPEAFGTFMRQDGAQQTTYFGWPLYYYKKDADVGATGGQGKGKVWYLAEAELPNLVIMRAPQELEGVKYLADGRGHTLYAHEGDELGSDDTPPRPLCTGECQRYFRPFSVRALHPVTELEPGELSTFVQGQGAGQQVSFRGQPLYLSKEDEKSGDMNGLLQEGFTLVEP